MGLRASELWGLGFDARKTGLAAGQEAGNVIFRLAGEQREADNLKNKRRKLVTSRAMDAYPKLLNYELTISPKPLNSIELITYSSMHYVTM